MGKDFAGWAVGFEFAVLNESYFGAGGQGVGCVVGDEDGLDVFAGQPGLQVA